jgi:hypothetical protein
MLSSNGRTGLLKVAKLPKFLTRRGEKRNRTEIIGDILIRRPTKSEDGNGDCAFLPSLLWTVFYSRHTGVNGRFHGPEILFLLVQRSHTSPPSRQGPSATLSS